MPASPDADWDVVVVGAGPAGARAALGAQQSGARTLLIDAAAFPRYKTCGGGLIGVSASLIPDLDSVPPLDVVDRISVTLRQGSPRERSAGQRMLYMVSRVDLDAHLVTLAQAAGVTFRPSCRLTDIAERDGVVHLQTSTGPLTAASVVGADGSASRLARHVGVDYAITDLGLEVEYAAEGARSIWRGRVHLDWGAIPGSYGWLFPKGDSLTVGVIGERGNADGLKAYLEQFARYLGLSGHERLKQSGHLTRCRSANSPLSRGRVLVAGDAAGLLEPFTREGISYAVRSGDLAGRAAADLSRAVESIDVTTATSRYAQAVERVLGPDMRAGFLCRRAFAAQPRLFHLLLATGPGWTYFVRLCGGDTTLARATRHRIVADPLRAVNWVTRQTHGAREQYALAEE